jgi:hypothetical protein
MTYLQIVNSVLRRLREAEVSSVANTDYSKLIGDFVNDAKREVEDSWNWIQLRTTIQVTTVASTWRYTLTGSGDRSKILQVLNDTEDVELKRVPYKWMNKQFILQTPQEETPMYYDVNGNTSGDMNVDLYLIPNAVEVINFNMVVPQDDLSSSTDDNTSVTVPSKPVILGAYAKALAERGEDGGTQFKEALIQYEAALADAIAIDAMNYPQELVWEVY